MHCPALNQLPSPPPNKTDWPWTEQSPSLPDQMPDGRPWPKISIVTPSYNQGQFLEETIRSVLLQGYPNLEYIVIDGGSADDSLNIIHKYEPWITYWISEPDRGQAHAINKGFAKCTGDLLGWLNSDDFLLSEALTYLAKAYVQHQEAILLGDVLHFTDLGDYARVAEQRNITFQNMVNVWTLYTSEAGWSQQGTYVPRKLYQQVGGVDETLRYVFDYDWMCQLLQAAPVYYLHTAIAGYRKHDTSKTVAETPAWLPEVTKVVHRYQNSLEDNIDKTLLQAGLEMYGAYIFLSVTGHWNRQKGLRHLIRAFQKNWQVLLSGESLQLCVRAITPLTILRLTKSLKIVFHNWGKVNV
jgi:glycosyltransferase involved in cell wall biosynthesis